MRKHQNALNTLVLKLIFTALFMFIRGGGGDDDEEEAELKKYAV